MQQYSHLILLRDLLKVGKVNCNKKKGEFNSPFLLILHRCIFYDIGYECDTYAFNIFSNPFILALN